MNYEVCKDCQDNDPFYGCINQDCEVYQDIKADNMMQEHFDNMREEELLAGFLDGREV